MASRLTYYRLVPWQCTHDTRTSNRSSHYAERKLSLRCFVHEVRHNCFDKTFSKNIKFFLMQCNNTRWVSLGCEIDPRSHVFKRLLSP